MTIFDTELRQTFRAHIIYEQITGETFKGKDLTSIIVFFYSTLMACNPNLTLEFDDFINWLDSEPDKLGEFTNWLLKLNNVEEGLTEKKKENKTSKKQPAKKKK